MIHPSLYVQPLRQKFYTWIKTRWEKINQLARAAFTEIQRTGWEREGNVQDSPAEITGEKRRKWCRSAPNTSEGEKGFGLKYWWESVIQKGLYENVLISMYPQAKPRYKCLNKHESIYYSSVFQSFLTFCLAHLLQLNACKQIILWKLHFLGKWSPQPPLLWLWLIFPRSHYNHWIIGPKWITGSVC